MFSVEYRTLGQNGRQYPSQFAAIGVHKAQTASEAAAYVAERFGRVEVLNVEARA